MKQALSIAIPVTALVTMVTILIWAFAFAESKAEQMVGIYLGVGVAVVVFVGRAVVFAMQIGIWPFLRNLLIIGGLFVALIGGYTFRHEVSWIADRMLRELNPRQPSIQADGTVAIMAGEDGHYRMRLLVNGTSTTFMIDTGATNIVLAPHHARMAGIDVAALTFDQETETANGIGRAAIVRLDSLQIGALKLQDLPARVNAAPMSDSLLGMEFLKRLSSWRVENGVLILVP